MSHDPYAPASRRHANRATVTDPGGQAGADVPGNERELLDWLAEPVLVDPVDLDELARRVDAAEARETVRGGDMRPAVMDAVEAARALIRGDATLAAPFPPAADPPTGDAPPLAGAAALVREVPDTATDVVEWIRAAPAARRPEYAAAAWAVEQQRAGKPRKTVADETSKYRS